MKPFPHTEVNILERAMNDMRDEITSLRIQLKNAESCMIALQQKRQDVITEAREGDLYEQMFGEKVKTLWDHLDTPMAEEIYGG